MIKIAVLKISCKMTKISQHTRKICKFFERIYKTVSCETPHIMKNLFLFRKIVQNVDYFKTIANDIYYR